MGVVACHLGAHGGGCSVPSYGTGRTPDIVEYKVRAPSPLYDLIIGKQTLHDIGVVLDFKEKTIYHR